MKMSFLKNKFLLKKFNLIYLATPYSKYPSGHEEAWLEACRVAGIFIREGLVVYCPIAHTHPIAHYGQVDKVDHNFWMRVDTPLMNASDALVVVCMPKWRDSLGITHEIKKFEADRKPVFLCTWPKLEIETYGDYAPDRKPEAPRLHSQWRS